MSDKVSSRKIWNILCFISLGLFGITRFLQLIQVSAPWFVSLQNVCNLIIGVLILISAWNAVAHEKKGWKITYWVLVAIVLVSVIIPLIIA